MIGEQLPRMEFKNRRGVAVMLLAFISLMEAINIMFGSVGSNFKQLIGYVLHQSHYGI